jgi:hypothetical protein
MILLSDIFSSHIQKMRNIAPCAIYGSTQNRVRYQHWPACQNVVIVQIEQRKIAVENRYCSGNPGDMAFVLSPAFTEKYDPACNGNTDCRINETQKICHHYCGPPNHFLTNGSFETPPFFSQK